jgi:hypothetical protein
MLEPEIAALEDGAVWFGQGVGLLSGSHNIVLVDVGAGVAALGINLMWFALR